MGNADGNHGDAELRVSVQPRRRGTTETRSSGIPFEEEGRSSVVPWLQGQSTLEYAVFIAVVAAALLTMNVYVRRAIQANLKLLEDQVNAEALQ